MTPGGPMSTSRVAIVGSGIAGLTLAAALDQERFEVTIYEAQPERGGSGSALGLWPPARRTLERLRALPPLGAQPREGGLYRLDGRPLVRFRARSRLLQDRSPQLVDRPALLAALDTAVPTTVHRVTREVTDPAELEADLVIGADGVRSRVRGLVDARAADRRETPVVALRGISAGWPDDAVAGEYWGDGMVFGIVPMPGERTYWFSAARSDLREPVDPQEALAEARDRFRNAAPVVRQHLAAAGPETLATRLWVTPPMRSYARGRYVVIGDAAHAMTPNLGRGACSAIVDAATLAATLNRGGDLRVWQARRVPATQLARVASGALLQLVTRE
jgi:2-polyprenyl-6-methoxyphenol hydroxylase-like FAD-dependent oxidoreductase